MPLTVINDTLVGSDYFPRHLGTVLAFFCAFIGVPPVEQYSIILSYVLERSPFWEFQYFPGSSNLFVFVHHITTGGALL